MANVTFQSSVPATAPAGTIVETVDQGGGVLRQKVSVGDGTVAVSSATVTLSSNPTVIPSSAINVSFVGIPSVALSTTVTNIVAVSSGIITLSSAPNVTIASGTVTLSSNPTVIPSSVQTVALSSNATTTPSSAVQVTLTSNTVAVSSGTITLSSAPSFAISSAIQISSGTITLSSNPTVIPSSAVTVTHSSIATVFISTTPGANTVTLSSNPTVIQSSALQISSGTVTLSSNPTVIPSSAVQVTLTSNVVALSSVATVTLSSNPTITSLTSGTVVISNGSNLANVVAGSSAVTSTMAALVVAISTLGNFTVATTISAAASGGATNLHFFTSTATPAANLIKASAGTLYGVQAVNISSIPTYLKLYNASTSATSVGTTTPLVTIPVPSVQTTGAGISAPFPVGIAFGTAISYALTGGSSDTDTSTTLIGTTINVQFA